MTERSNASISPPVLFCTITVEKLTTQGAMQKSTTYKNTRLLLGRNEFRDIILQMETTKVCFKFVLRDFSMHKRFMKDGKATLHLKDQLTNLMIANAPPNLLFNLLKVLSSKAERNMQDQKTISARQRMLSSLPRTFEEISPMTVKEFESLRHLNGKLPLCERNPNINLPGSSPFSSKRKIEKLEKDPLQRLKRDVFSLYISRKCPWTVRVTIVPPKNFSYEKPAKSPRFMNPIILNEEQKRVMSSVQAGYNVFFTGSAGTGKSFLLKRIVGALPPDVTYVTASTGIAACHIGGTTLHSFAGIGSGSASVEECINLAKRKAFSVHWKNCNHLIIDEISMVDGDYFKKMEAAARYIRRNDKPFGGIQLIVCGDFLQLPPVARKGEKRSFCFQSSAWNKCINATFELTQVKRQNDPLFIDILQNLRIGRCSAEDEKVLKETIHNSMEKDGIKATRLCTHKEDVEHINNVQLNKLSGDEKTFLSVDSDPYLSDTLDSNTPVPGKLTLKVGAQVMLMKNLDVSQGFVNGARGVVEAFVGTQGLPLVKFACGATTEIKHQKWMVKTRGGLIVTRRQIPLKLAWAFSIHKSQGMTLDCVEMSLSKVFEAGQAYVALSRARNLKSLRLLDFSPSSIKAHAEVQQFYNNLKRQLCSF